MRHIAHQPTVIKAFDLTYPHQYKQILPWVSLLWLVTGCVLPTPIATPQTHTGADSDGLCPYQVAVRAVDTNVPIANTPITNAQLTVVYTPNATKNELSDTAYTDVNGKYEGQVHCEEMSTRYRLHIDANGYHPYQAERTFMENHEAIYLIAETVAVCPSIISVLDAQSKERITEAKVRLIDGVYNVMGYTDSEGNHQSMLPCIAAASGITSSITATITAPTYESQSIAYTISKEIQEIYLVRQSSPTPTPTPTLFPPRADDEILVLIADFWVSEEEKDREKIALNLQGELTDYFKDHDKIRVEYWPEPISPEEDGQERAQQIGLDPNIDANFVIWGYRIPKTQAWNEDEVYVFFNIMQQNLLFFGRTYDRAYRPGQGPEPMPEIIQQPRMFEFKTNLGTQWSHLLAFATGLTLYQANDHTGAEPLFNRATSLFERSNPLAIDPDMIRAIYFYRGTNYLHLGRANLAQSNLQTLYDILDTVALTESDWGLHALVNLGMASLDVGQVDQAMQLYEQALDIVHKTRDQETKGTVLMNLGSVYIDMGDYTKALETYEQALAIAQINKDQRIVGANLGNIGIVYHYRGQVEKATEMYEQALTIAREVEDRAYEGIWVGNLGTIYFDMGQVEQAIEMYEQALAIAREINNYQSEGMYLGNLGNAYVVLGQVEQAIEMYEQALAIAREIKNRPHEGAWLGNLAVLHEHLADYDKSIEFAKQALEIARETKDRYSEGQQLGNLANAYNRLGQYQTAIDYYEQILIIFRDLESPAGEVAALTNMGIAYHSLGQIERAIELYEQALPIAQEIKARSHEAVLLGGMSNAYVSLGMYAKAIETYEQTLAMTRELKDRPNEGKTLGNLGIAYISLGQVEKAIALYEQALVIAREVHDRNGEEKYLGNLGTAYNDLGEYEKAIEFHEQALAIAREIKDRPSEGTRLGNLGVTYNNMGEYEKGIAYFTESYEILAAIQSPRASTIYNWLGNAYHQMCRTSSLNGNPDVALPYCTQAVNHDTQTYLAYHSRGLTYALLGETEKAIADFRFVVDALQKLDHPEATADIEVHQSWIEALEAGEEPFTDEVLAGLREE